MLSRSSTLFVFLFSYSVAYPQWVELENLPSWGIEASYKMGDVLWVGTSNGLYSSVDTGRTFRMEEALPRGLDVVGIKEMNGELLVLGKQFLEQKADLLLCKLINGGKHWQIIPTGILPHRTIRFEVINDRIYIGVCPVNIGTCFLYRSDDNGSTFKQISVHPFISMITGQDSIVLALSYKVLYISYNYGENFSKIYGELNIDNSLRQVFIRDSTLLMTTYFGEFLTSENLGETWDTTGTPFLGVWWLYEIPDTDSIYIYEDGKHYFSDDFYQTWEFIGNDEPYNVNIPGRLYNFGNRRIKSERRLYLDQADGNWEPIDQGMFNGIVAGLRTDGKSIVAFINGEICRSSDLGSSWNRINPPNANSNGWYELALHDNWVYLYNFWDIYATPDNGITWKKIYFDKPEWLWNDESTVYFLRDTSALYRVDGEMLTLISDDLPGYSFGFCPVEDGYWHLDKGYNLYFLPKGGTQWEFKTQVRNGSMSSRVQLKCYKDLIIFTQHGTIFTSYDNGTTWNEYNLPVLNHVASKPGTINRHNGSLYIGGQHPYAGVMVSHDKGATWSFFNGNLENTYIENMILSGDRLYANMEDFGGLWSRSLKGTLVSGKVFSDVNSNHIFDRHEKPVANIPVIARPSNKATRTDSNGFYLLELPLGDTLSVVTASAYDEVEPDLAVASNGAFRQDFAIQPQDVVHDAGVFIGPTSEINKLTSVKFKVTAINSGTMPLANSQLILHLPRNWKFYKANPAPTSVETDSVRWAFADLPAGKSVTIQIEAVAIQIVPGQTEKIYARINADQADTYPFNNSFVRECMLGNPILPLSKEVFPTPYLHPDYSALNQRLEYSIIFDYPQTNGLPFTISDTLSPYLNLQTFALTYSDVPCTWEILDNRVIRFTFTPDGIPKQQRVVRFSIEPEKGLPVGTLMTNTAMLESPQHSPIVSLPAVAEINYPWPQWKSPGNPGQLQCYPNPAGNFSVATWSKPLSKDGLVEVYNTQGQLTSSHQIGYGSSQFWLPTDVFPSGLYFIRIVAEEQKYVGKLIVE
ncbi:MAG: T9SS C-terminal target domain-containing protein [Haliscomenobacteraceae bacterium CHB4]|nr:hypothetical protein [Saprospiraceae bacterium]MCE7925738.1 T9SS C-terminal target domain-containing protein [Haliscomenobacteraceae bacterium CHB4]